MEQVFNKIIQTQHPKILAIAKNYGKHVIEMGGKANPSQPVIFSKNFTSIVQPGTKEINFIQGRDVHHEVELGFIMKKQATNVKNIDIKDYIGGYFLAIDFTERKMQSKLKEQGFPWEVAKAFDNSLPISNFIEYEKVKDVTQLELEFKINNKTIQKDITDGMIHKIPQLIEYTSQFITLNPGDMFITGTPSGVGPVKDKDHVQAYLRQGSEVLAEIDTKINYVAPKL